MKYGNGLHDMIQDTKNEQQDEQREYFLFDNTIKVWFPNDFCESPEMIEKRYPFKNRPSIIKADPTGKVFITFDLYSKSLNALQVISAAASIRRTILQVYPYNNKMKLKRFTTNQGLQGYSFPFYILHKYGRQFIEFFILSLHSQLFLGTMTCPEQNRREWDAVFTKVKSAVQEIEQTNNTKEVFV